MDSTVKYRQVVIDTLQKHADFRNRADQDDITAQPLFDTERDQYMIVDAGWMGYKRIRSIVIFVRVIDGKIWIEEDWTEYGIADELVKRGVPHGNIVLGFKHPIELQSLPFLQFSATRFSYPASHSLRIMCSLVHSKIASL